MCDFRSKFRVGRISLTSEHLAAYYGVDVSDVEDFATTVGEKTIADRIADSTVAPSFHCTIPNSPFESYYRSSLSQTQHTWRPSASTNNDGDRTQQIADTTIAPSFHCTLPNSPFESYYESSFSQSRCKSSIDADASPMSPLFEASGRRCSSTMDYSMQKLPMSTLTAFDDDKEQQAECPMDANERTFVGDASDLDGRQPSTVNGTADESTSTLHGYDEAVMTAAQLVAPPIIRTSHHEDATSMMDFSLAAGHTTSGNAAVSGMDKSTGLVESSTFVSAGGDASGAQSTTAKKSIVTLAQALQAGGEPPHWSQQPRIVPRFSTVGLYGARRSVIGQCVDSTVDDSSTTYSSSKRSTTPSFPNIPFIVPKAVDVGNPALRKFQALMADFDCAAGQFAAGPVPTNNAESTITLADEASSFRQTVSSDSASAIDESGAAQATLASDRKSVLLPTHRTKALAAELQQQFQLQSVAAAETRSRAIKAAENLLPAIPQARSQPSIGGETEQNNAMDKVESPADKTLKSAIKRPQEFGRKSMALREIICNYATPPSASRVSRRKSVTFRTHHHAVNASGGVVASHTNSDDGVASPAAKQILLSRVSQAVAGPRASPLFGADSGCMSVDRSAEKHRPSSAVGEDIVVGSLDDGSFTTLQLRDSFFSEISDLSPIKGVTSSACNVSFATSSPQVARHRFSSIAGPPSPYFPRGAVIASESFDYDGYDDDTRCSEGNHDAELHNLSQDLESMDLGGAPTSPPAGADLSSTPISARSDRRRSIDNSIFTTGANESSFHVDAALPMDNSVNSDAQDDDGGSEWADETALSAVVISDDALDRTDNASSSFAARRQSCASCGPSRTHVVMNYAKPRDSPVYVLPAPKIVQHKENAILADDGLRHSKRNRLPRLNCLQKPVYERDASGNLNLVGVSDVVVRDKLLKKHLVTDAVVAMEKEQELKQRKRLQQEKRKKLKAAGTHNL